MCRLGGSRSSVRVDSLKEDGRSRQQLQGRGQLGRPSLGGGRAGRRRGILGRFRGRRHGSVAAVFDGVGVSGKYGGFAEIL